ncbi:MAG: aminotransferase class V-fold PLP-dependent enzyme, partial [Nostocaceae cyanobacterium]|nr:aminotransferase class V-fold PLP-dependent enzyme [Nostocaceae cyanobacterium]
FVEALKGIPNIHVFVPHQHTSIVSFTVDGISPQAIETALGAQNIAVRAGLHCAPWAHEFAGTNQLGGSVRLSVGYFNDQSDLEQLAYVFEQIIQ